MESGFVCKQAFDIDKKVIDIHRLNLGDSATQADLRLITKEQLSEKGRPSVVIAGSPCQGFSTAGKRDLYDPRNALLLCAAQLAIQVKPKVFIAENVSGALSGDHKIYWQQLDEMLRAVGYSTMTLKLNASELGLAQSRSRVIMLAWKGAKEPKFEASLAKQQTLAHALSGIEGLAQHEKKFLPLDSSHFLIANRIKRGQKLCNVRGGAASIHTWDIPEVFGKTTAQEKRLLHATMKLRRTERLRNFGDADPVSLAALERDIGIGASKLITNLIAKGYMRKLGDRFDLVNTFNGKYRRLDWDSISLTVDTRFGDPRYFLHPTEHRSFTVREAARIQGFPDWFMFPGNAIDSFKMIGNAVPPPMAKYLADGIRGLLM